MDTRWRYIIVLFGLSGCNESPVSPSSQTSKEHGPNYAAASTLFQTGQAAFQFHELPFDTLDEKRKYLNSCGDLVHATRQQIAGCGGIAEFIDSLSDDKRTRTISFVKPLQRMFYCQSTVSQADGDGPAAADYGLALLELGSLVVQLEDLRTYGIGWSCCTTGCSRLCNVSPMLNNDLRARLVERLEKLENALESREAIFSRTVGRKQEFMSPKDLRERELADLRNQSAADAAILRMCRISIAVDIYQDQNGTFPSSLEDLRQYFNGDVPSDPLSGNSFLLRPLAPKNECKVYSMGVDKVDNGGEFETNRHYLSHFPEGYDFILESF